MKKISVIVPCYNAEKYIDRCVRSIVRQTIGIDSLEIILVNDVSTDRTLEKILRWERRFPDSIIVINRTENGRTGGARNDGIRYASAPYLTFVDNDDWIDPTMYKKMYHAMIENECDMVAVLYDREEENGKKYNMKMPEGKKDVLVYVDNKPEDVADLPGEVWTKLYSKKIILENEIFFPEKMSYAENCWGEILRYYIKSYYVIGERLYHYMVNPQSIICSGHLQSCKERLVIENILLDEIEKRGLDDIHSTRLSYDFIYKYYLNTLHILFSSGQLELYSLYEEMKKGVLDRYPEYYKNDLLKNDCENKEIYFFLRTLEIDMSNEMWKSLGEKYQKSDWDISMYDSYIIDDSYDSKLDPRLFFKQKYYKYRGLRKHIQKFLQKEQDMELWKDTKEKILVCIKEDLISEQFIDDNSIREKCNRIVNLEIIQALIKEIDFAKEKEEFPFLIKKLYSFLELPESLWRMVWGRGEFLADELIPALEYSYQQVQEEEIINLARKIVEIRENPTFSHSYMEKEYSYSYAWDDVEGMYYFIYENRNIYLPYKYYSTPEKVEHYIRGLMVEQDPRSAHCYLNDRMQVPEGAVVMDAGVAEGNFAAMVIDKVKKIYLVECDEDYIQALKVTFRDCLEKIVFVPKFLGNIDDDSHATIDGIMQGERLDYLKMDIEGAEIDALEGGETTLRDAEGIKCNICAYHRFRHNKLITEKMLEWGFDVENSSGWMTFPWDPEYPHYPRRGLVQAIKKNLFLKSV